MAKRKLKLKKKARNLFLVILIFLAVFFFAIAYFNIQLSPMDRNSTEEIKVIIEPGIGSRGIAERLKEEGLIRNANFFVLYVKLTGETTLKAATYTLSPSMSVKQIVARLKGNQADSTDVQVTIKEGLNMVQLASLIEEKLGLSSSDFLTKMKDRTYVTSLVKRYWFLTNEMLDSEIYYPLEGYLFPDTYSFAKEVTIEQFVTTLLDQTDKVLKPYQQQMEQSGSTYHQILTLSSIVELEGVSREDRELIASVFYNRLAAGWSLGSDVTTCYGAQVSLKECNDSINFNEKNSYNTRNSSMAGKLPIGPICNPSKESIESVLTKRESDYYYFVADKNKQVYFTKNEREHNQMIQTIKQRGDWPW